MATGCGGKGKGPEKLQNTLKRMTPPTLHRNSKSREQDAYLAQVEAALSSLSSGGPFCSTLSRPLEGCVRQGRDRAEGRSEGTCMQGWGAGRPGADSLH